MDGITYELRFTIWGYHPNSGESDGESHGTCNRHFGVL